MSRVKMIKINNFNKMLLLNFICQTAKFHSVLGRQHLNEGFYLFFFYTKWGLTYINLLFTNDRWWIGSVTLWGQFILLFCRENWQYILFGYYVNFSSTECLYAYIGDLVSISCIRIETLICCEISYSVLNQSFIWS